MKKGTERSQEPSGLATSSFSCMSLGKGFIGFRVFGLDDRAYGMGCGFFLICRTIASGVRAFKVLGLRVQGPGSGFGDRGSKFGI